MGLDTVELVMKVEETFDLTIPDEEAEKILTLGDLYRFVLDRLEQPADGPSRCLSAQTFYRLRRHLMGGFRVERRRIRPASELAELFPEASRRADWSRLGASMGWELPPLLPPKWVESAGDWLFVAWLVACVGLGVQPVPLARGVAIALMLTFTLGTVAMGWALYRATKPLATRFPVVDVRGLVPLLLAENVEKIRRPNPRGWTRPEVWSVLVAITASVSGVTPDQLNESTSFVNDLGM